MLRGATAPLLAEEGQLDQFEKKLDSPETASKPSPKPSPREEKEDRYTSHNSSTDCVGDDLASSFFGCLLFELMIKPIALGPFYIPHLALEDSFDRTPHYARFPFADDSDGHENENGKLYSLRVGSAFQWINPKTHGVRGDVSLKTSHRFGLDASFTRYEERLQEENRTLSFGEVVPTYAFAQSERCDFRAGVGYQWVDGVRYSDRLKLMYAAHFFLKPLQIGMDSGVGILNGRPLWEVSPGIGLHWSRIEWRAAYRWRIISDETISGPEVGIAIWF